MLVVKDEIIKLLLKLLKQGATGQSPAGPVFFFVFFPLLSSPCADVWSIGNVF